MLTILILKALTQFLSVVIRTQLVSRTIRSNKQSRARYKTRLDSGRVSILASLLLPCSSSLSESELKSLVSRSSLILFLVLLACSLVSLSLTCNKVSLHFRVVRPGMWRRWPTRQDTRPKTHTQGKILVKAVVRQLVLFLINSDQRFWSELIFWFIF